MYTMKSERNKFVSSIDWVQHIKKNYILSVYLITISRPWSLRWQRTLFSIIHEPRVKNTLFWFLFQIISISQEGKTRKTIKNIIKMELAKHYSIKKFKIENSLSSYSGFYLNILLGFIHFSCCRSSFIGCWSSLTSNSFFSC